MPIRKPIDWNKPHLRLAYLVEGVFRDPHGGEHFVRWCGPSDRTGSGFVAYATLGHASHPMTPAKNELPQAPVAWESRLSRCIYDAELGTLKQNIQSLSEVKARVALGDTDNPTSYTSFAELRDMALYGRWRGQRARLILVDADEIERYEILVDGTWDRDPDRVGPYQFNVVINAGEIIPPTLGWGTQVPDTTDYWVEYSYSGTVWSPDGSGTPSFELNPDHRGLWLGEVFGGATHNNPSTSLPITTEQVWKELVPYGRTNAFIFAWVSPRLDQFCYDVVFETEGGLIKMSALTSDYAMRCFNNNDPLRGPVGTCVMFRQQGGNNFEIDDGNRAWGKVGGGHPVLRPPGYQDIGAGDPELGNNGSGGLCLPLNTAFNPQSECNVVATFGDLIQDAHFLGRPGLMHPSALSHLMAMSVLYGLPWEFRTAAVPRGLEEDAVSFRDVMESLMRSIPADLTLRVDPADGRRKYFAVVRQQPGQTGAIDFFLEDLANADLPADVHHSADPDGYYSNDSSFRTEDYYNPPITGTPDGAGDELIRTNHMQASIVDLLEQSSSKYGIAVESTETLPYWRFEDGNAFRVWAGLLEAPRSMPQKVIEATHGYRAMRLDLGRVVEYKIDGVFAGPGQIRGMRFDLDRQLVVVRTYHQPIEPRVHDTTSTVRDKERAVAHKDTPVIDRHEEGG